MGLLKKIKKVLSSFCCKLTKKSPQVLDSENTLKYILENNVSIGRYGDGELEIMYGNDIKFQKFHSQLSEKLKEVKTNEKFLTCIPCIFNKNSLNKEGLVESEYKFWKKHLIGKRFLWYKYFQNQFLGDALISRFYIRYKDKSKISDYVCNLKKLWDKRNVVFVEGEKSRLGVGNDLFDNAKSIKRILCPMINAYDKYDEIKQTIIDNVSAETLIIMALGPTATVLSYELSDRFQCLDLGHIDIEYEWFLAKTDKKIPILNKHVNECNETLEDDQEDREYLKQIWFKIGV